MTPVPTSAIEAEEILEDPSASDWLKGALRSAIERDPVDALNDALVIGRHFGGAAADRPRPHLSHSPIRILAPPADTLNVARSTF